MDAVEVPQADKGWRWPLKWAETVLIGGLLRQQPRGFVVGVQPDERSFVPCIIMSMVEDYPHLADNAKSSLFVWFVSRAPDAYLRTALHAESDAVPKLLMQIAVDVAITHSFHLGHEGRIGLHAAPAGEAPLIRKYEQDCGMVRLPEDVALPVGFRKLMAPNRGRYFYHSEDTALAASRRLDFCR
ncbi:MAG TPA: hypothetical protein VGQ36_20525 [Thermoanaerobaculia bacterium]|nr:hypothetical protein [Thermoanaerobaculia bacterium]